MTAAQKLETILQTNMGERRWHESAACLVEVVLCPVTFVEELMMRQTDLTMPFSYQCDRLLYYMITKAIINNGGWMTNDSLGAPPGKEMHDLQQNNCFSYLFNL